MTDTGPVTVEKNGLSAYSFDHNGDIQENTVEIRQTIAEATERGLLTTTGDLAPEATVTAVNMTFDPDKRLRLTFRVNVVNAAKFRIHG